MTQDMFAQKEKKQESIPELSKKGYWLLKQNDTNAAIEAFKKILRQDDSNSYALVGIGDAYRKQRYFRKAIDYYSLCLEDSPQNNYALFGMGECYKATKEWQKAIDVWQQYRNTDSTNITVITRIADAYRKIKNFQKSKQTYLEALQLQQDNSYALIGLGHLFYDNKEYENALFYWNKIFEKDIEFADIRVLTSIGNCHRKLKTFDEGVKFFQKALQKEPDNFYALFGLADCYRGQKDSKKALEYWNKILCLEPHNKIILTRAGDAYRTQGDFEKAACCYQKALEIDFDPYAALGQALIFKAKGEYQKAIEKLQDLPDTAPLDYRFFLELSFCYSKIGEKQKALDILLEYQRRDKNCDVINEAIQRLKNMI